MNFHVVYFAKPTYPRERGEAAGRQTGWRVNLNVQIGLGFPVSDEIFSRSWVGALPYPVPAQGSRFPVSCRRQPLSCHVQQGTEKKG